MARVNFDNEPDIKFFDKDKSIQDDAFVTGRKTGKKLNEKNEMVPIFEAVNAAPYPMKHPRSSLSSRSTGFRPRRIALKYGKKTRKHKGIIQTGGNKGKLKKGYRYSGKKTKTGLSIIVKVSK
jgi:hypothetical protein